LNPKDLASMVVALDFSSDQDEGISAGLAGGGIGAGRFPVRLAGVE
jgi:hypothetical protein